MSHTATFTGAGFVLVAVHQLAPAKLRLTYGGAPRLASSASSNDATNPANYTLSGPGSVTVTAAYAVGIDAVDLVLSTALSPGVWTLGVANVTDVDGASLEAPTSQTFTAMAILPTAPLSQGAETDTPETLLRKYLSPALKGPGWDAMLHALAVGDAYKEDLARAAFDQLFKSTASGQYLDRRAADDGLTRPSGIGIADEVFRKLAIKTTARKQIVQVMLEALEAYYGPEATRAHASAGAHEPYSLEDGDTLLVQIDGGRLVAVRFETDDFENILAATAAEVTSAINRAFREHKLSAYALAMKDPVFGKSIVRIFSGALGISGGVAILGGRAQVALRFPSVVHTPAAGPQAGVSFAATVGTGANGIPAGVVRFSAVPDITYNGELPVLTYPQLHLTDVLPGDYVVLAAPALVDAQRDTFEVVSTTPISFDVKSAVTEWPTPHFTTTTAQQVRFYRPTKQTIMATRRMATVLQGDAGVLDVILPATTQAVARGKNTGAYLHDTTPVSIASGVRDESGLVTINTSSSHGLVAGRQVDVRDTVASHTAWTPPTFQTDVQPPGPTGGYDGFYTVLSDGRILYGGGSGTATDGYTTWDANAETWIYDPKTNTRARVADRLVPRYGGAKSVLLKDGRVLLTDACDIEWMGGHTEIYDPATNSWSRTGDGVGQATQWGPSDGSLTTLQDGRVFAFGGYYTTARAEIYNPATGQWANTSRPMVGGSVAPWFTGSNSHKATLLRDGRVLITGGWYGSSGVVEYPIIYNPWNDSWTRCAKAANGWLWYHTAELLDTDDVLIIGGDGRSPETLLGEAGTPVQLALNRVWLFNPSTLTMKRVANLNVARESHSSCLLPDGRVAVYSGVGRTSRDTSGPPLDSLEIYDPLTNTWTLVGNSGRASANSWIVPLADGSLFVFNTNVNGVSWDAVPQPAQRFSSMTKVISSGDLNGVFRVESVLSPTSFTYRTETRSTATLLSGTVRPVASATNSIQGPFIYDTQAGLALTSVSVKTAEPLVRGRSYTMVTVEDDTAVFFPDEPGWVVFNFGTSSQIAPVKYLGRLSDEHLLLDPSFVFPHDIPVGSTITMLKSRGLGTPARPENVGSLYVTAAAAGRVAAQATIDDLVAAGVIVNTTITYPGDAGLGNEGCPAEGAPKLSDKVAVWGSDSLDTEIQAAREDK